MRILLLFFICISLFLAGMVFGGQEQATKSDSSLVEVEETDIPNQPNATKSITVDEPSHMNFTQKAASFLEGAVEGIYDIIVTILYEIASIFFSIV